MYTVELYKEDRRTHLGHRLVMKTDWSTNDRQAILEHYTKKYPESRGYFFKIVTTMVKRKNAITGQEFEERYDTPYFCSPSSETYWSS